MKVKRDPRKPLTNREKEYLLYALPIGGKPYTDDEAREAWKAWREELLEEWIRENPGSRPWLWWKWEAPPEERRRLGGRGTPMRDVPGTRASTHGLWLGAPNYWQDRDPDDPPVFESEAEYLDRWRLLTAREKRQLARRNQEPPSEPALARVVEFGARSADEDENEDEAS